MTFDWMWSNNFAWLAEQGEAPLISASKRYYFNDIELEKFEADWRQGLDKLVPASHTGTQAQESWHLHRLRATMENLRLPVSEVVSKIQDLLAVVCRGCHNFPYYFGSSILRNTVPRK